MITRRRDRSVIFRLNDDEYESLVAAASTSRLRSVAEFIRTAVMNAIDSGIPERTAPGLHALERRIRGLEETLYRPENSK